MKGLLVCPEKKKKKKKKYEHSINKVNTVIKTKTIFFNKPPKITSLNSVFEFLQGVFY